MGHLVYSTKQRHQGLGTMQMMGRLISDLWWSVSRLPRCLGPMGGVHVAPRRQFQAVHVPTHHHWLSAHRQVRSILQFCSDQEEILELESSKLSMAPGF